MRRIGWMVMAALGLSAGAARADFPALHLISYASAPYTVTATALDSVQNDGTVSTMGMFVSVTDPDGNPVHGLQPSEFTTTAVGAQSVTQVSGEIDGTGVYEFFVGVTLDPFRVQGRSAVALVQVKHSVATSLTTGVIYQGQALARADFTRACK